MKSVLIVFFLFSPISFAHKVITLVYATGMMIEGQVGFSNGEFALKGTQVDVFLGGDKVSTVEIGDEGSFFYTAEGAADYTFVADMGVGHVAHMSVSADELGGRGDVVSSTQAPSATLSGLQISDVERVVAKQIKPLRQDILALKEKRRWMDIVGGIGFIVGLFGCFAWLQARRIQSGTTPKYVNS